MDPNKKSQDGAPDAGPTTPTGKARDESRPLDAAANAAPSDELAARTKERDEIRDHLQRTAAEFQNFKARTAREKTEARRFAIADAVRSVLPALDNLERATAAADATNPAALVMGVRMVVEQFRRGLEELGVKPVQTDGALLDPTCMEAISRVETTEVRENQIVEVFEKGYKLADLVIRPARVTVAATPRPRTASAGPDEPSDA